MTAEEVKLAIKAEQAIFDLLDSYNRATLSLGNFSVKSDVDKETEPGKTIFTLRVSVFMPDNKTVFFDQGLIYKYNTGFYSSAYEPLNFDQYASDISALMDKLANRL